MTDDTVIIADFKTNREIPGSAEDEPLVYRAQLAVYRAILQPLYPKHRFECVLIYTEGPVCVRLSEAMLDQSLVQLATK